MPLTRRKALSGGAAALAAMLAPRGVFAIAATTPPPVPPDTAPVSYAEGWVKWWNPYRGFGFVVVPDEDRDIFFQASKFDRNGIERPSGHRVWVRYASSGRGLIAERVRCINERVA
jgi:cold shock CspA family protein